MTVLVGLVVFLGITVGVLIWLLEGWRRLAESWRVLAHQERAEHGKTLRALQRAGATMQQLDKLLQRPPPAPPDPRWICHGIAPLAWGPGRWALVDVVADSPEAFARACRALAVGWAFDGRGGRA